MDNHLGVKLYKGKNCLSGKIGLSSVCTFEIYLKDR